jgi:hypothetical protein
MAAAILGLCVFLVVDGDEENDFKAAVSFKSDPYVCIARIAAEYLEAHTI